MKKDKNSTLVIDKSSKVEIINKLSDHFNCILLVALEVEIWRKTILESEIDWSALLAVETNNK